MTLYEINSNIEMILATMVDEETGEVNEESLKALEEMQIAKEEKRENIALYAKNLRAFCDSLKQEKLALAERQKQAENKYERIMSYLQCELDGEKLETSKVKVSYRKTISAVFDDAEICRKWLEDNRYFNAYKVEYSVSKSAVKELMKEGKDIPGTHLEENISMSIR